MYGSKGWLVPGRKPVSGKMPRIEAKDVVWLPFWFSCIPRPGGSGSSQKSLALVGGLVHVAGHDPPLSKGGSADWRGAKPRRSREPGVIAPGTHTPALFAGGVNIPSASASIAPLPPDNPSFRRGARRPRAGLDVSHHAVTLAGGAYRVPGQRGGRLVIHHHTRPMSRTGPRKCRKGGFR